MDIIEPKDAAEWRDWLKANHSTCDEIWLLLTKVGRGSGSLTMRESIDEALCFGWIDSKGKRLDENRYMLRLTPRKNATKWSQRNLRRAADLVDEGRMTEAGLAKLPMDFRASIVPPGSSPGSDEPLPPELEMALGRDIPVRNAFHALTPGKRREFIRWVSSAKRLETRKKRIERTLELVRSHRSLTEDMMDRWTK